MDELIECEGCRRHVRSTDVRCPFCGASVAPRARPPSRILGRMTRAAFFYGASALGCAEAPSAAPAERVEAPLMQPLSTEVVEASAIEHDAPEPLPAPVIEPDTPEEARAERADAEDLKRRERAPRVVRQVRPPPPPCCPAPPYGAPPFDFAV